MLQLSIDTQLQQDVDRILAKRGLSADMVVSYLYEYIRAEQEVPNILRIPNQLTRETIERSNAGLDITRCSSVEDLFQKLGI